MIRQSNMKIPNAARAKAGIQSVVWLKNEGPGSGLCRNDEFKFLLRI
jgi:hypothetical protein